MNGRSSYHRRPAYAAAAAIITLVAAGIVAGACSESVTAPTAAGADARVVPDAPWTAKNRGRGGVDEVPTSDERALSITLARSLAIAVNKPATRHELLEALAGSATRERKLHFASYMEGRGGRIIAAMASGGVADRAALRNAIAGVRDLELYMPVQSHRDTWTDAQEVLVATTLLENEAPIAFDRNGNQRTLSRFSPPDEPVLSLVPVETDFTSQIDKNRRGLAERTCTVGQGESLEKAARHCEAATSDASLSGDVAPKDDGHSVNASMSATGEEGAWLSFSRILNGQTGSECLGDCWYMGDPEYEYHVLARPTANAPLNFVQCISAYPTAGAQPGVASMDYYYDQNANFWSGRTKILDVARMDTYTAADGGWVLQLWEDDEGGCQVKGTNLAYIFVVLLGAGITAAGLVTGVEHHGDNTAGVAVWYGIVLAGQGLALLIAGGDDFVGTVVDKSKTAWANEWPGNTHAIMDGGTLHGRVTLDIIRTGDPPKIGGSVTSVELSADATLKLPLGTTKTLQAYPFDVVGVPVSGRPVTWVSTNTAVATVSNSGVVNANAIGSTTIRATIDGYIDETVLTVAAIGAVTTASITSPNPTVAGPMRTTQLTARGYDANGFEVPVNAWQWWSSDTLVATVNSSGLVTGRAESGGATYVWADIDGVSQQYYITVLPRLGAAISGPTEANPGTVCSFDGIGTGGSGNYRYSWRAGSHTLSGPYPWFTHSSNANYEVFLTITDLDTGLTAETYSPVSVFNGAATCN